MKPVAKISLVGADTSSAIISLHSCCYPRRFMSGPDAQVRGGNVRLGDSVPSSQRSVSPLSAHGAALFFQALSCVLER